MSNTDNIDIKENQPIKPSNSRSKAIKIDALSRAKLCDEICRDKNLKPSSFRVAYILLKYCNADKRHAYLGLTRLTEESAVSRSAAKAAIKELSEAGWFRVIRVKEDGTNRNEANQYWPAWDRIPASEKSDATVKATGNIVPFPKTDGRSISDGEKVDGRSISDRGMGLNQTGGGSNLDRGGRSNSDPETYDHNQMKETEDSPLTPKGARRGVSSERGTYLPRDFEMKSETQREVISLFKAESAFRVWYGDWKNEKWCLRDRYSISADWDLMLIREAKRHIKALDLKGLKPDGRKKHPFASAI